MIELIDGLQDGVVGFQHLDVVLWEVRSSFLVTVR